MPRDGDIDLTLHELVFHWRRRCVWEKEKVALDNRIAATCRQFFPDLEGEAQAKKAQTLAARGRKGESGVQESQAALFIVPLLMLQKPLVDTMKEIDKQEIIPLVRTLPVYQFMKDVPGLGEKGLACLIAEVGLGENGGGLSDYPNHRHVWKRLGLAPLNGKAASQWRREGGLSKDEWTALGYAPSRLGRVFGNVTAPMIQHKKKSRYGVVYTARREHTAVTHPDWSKGHSHNDAMRVMTKALVRDLWVAWNQPTLSVQATRPLAGSNLQVAA